MAEEPSRLLEVLEGSGSDRERQQAIDELARSGTSETTRLLIQTFRRSRWRSARFDLVRALGRTRHPRAVEFLLKLAADRTDFAIGSAAVLALAETGSSSAGE